VCIITFPNCRVVASQLRFSLIKTGQHFSWETWNKTFVCNLLQHLEYGAPKLCIYKMAGTAHRKRTCVLKTRSLTFTSLQSGTDIWGSQKFIPKLSFRCFWQFMHNLKTIHCPLPTDCTPKSIWRSFLSQLVNFTGIQHLVTALKLSP